MNITLKKLNRSYGELKQLCAQPLPKGKGDLARRLARVKRTADKAIDIWLEDQKAIALSYDFRIVGPGQIKPVKEGEEIKIETIEAFNRECDSIMESEAEQVHFRGEPFTVAEWKEAEPLFELSAEMLSQLDWLMPDEEASEEAEEKAASATA
jgi:hypothetical protein